MSEEVKPATNAQLKRIKDGIESTVPRAASDLAAQFVAKILIARIDAERALNAEMLAALKEAESSVMAIVDVSADRKAFVFGGMRSWMSAELIAKQSLADIRAVIAKAEGKALEKFPSKE